MINGHEVKSYKVTDQSCPDHLWFYHIDILKDGQVVWNDSILYWDRKGERQYSCPSFSGTYTSARKLVRDVANKVTRALIGTK